jgi:hypothetical protein
MFHQIYPHHLWANHHICFFLFSWHIHAGRPGASAWVVSARTSSLLFPWLPVSLLVFFYLFFLMNNLFRYFLYFVTIFRIPFCTNVLLILPGCIPLALLPPIRLLVISIIIYRVASGKLATLNSSDRLNFQSENKDLVCFCARETLRNIKIRNYIIHNALNKSCLK